VTGLWRASLTAGAPERQTLCRTDGPEPLYSLEMVDFKPQIVARLVQLRAGRSCSLDRQSHARIFWPETLALKSIEC
jgi:hypothetical protein